jgi:hypothetical protein
MDIFCPKCREPWDTDCLHERIEDENPNYRSKCMTNGKFDQKKYEEKFFNPMRAKFRTEGCYALGGGRCTPDAGAANRTSLLSEIHDLMGDDFDGEVSMMEDAKAFGLL